jgi:hypothetical protein
MFKWDTISWIATAIFVAGLALTVFVTDAFLVLLIGAYLLRPALLAFGLGTPRADERQLTIQFHSGNIALIVVILALAGFYIKARIDGIPADNYAMLLAIALVTKASIGLVMHGDYKVNGTRIGLFIALLYFLFVALSHSFSLTLLVEGAPAIAIAVFSLLGRKFPRIAAAFFALVGVAAFYMFGPIHKFTEGTLTTGYVLALPMLIAAFCFFRAGRPDEPHPAAATNHVYP